jgi:hypothetical protein
MLSDDKYNQSIVLISAPQSRWSEAVNEADLSKSSLDVEDVVHLPTVKIAKAELFGNQIRTLLQRHPPIHHLAV